jgi:cold shock CspA family protein
MRAMTTKATARLKGAIKCLNKPSYGWIIGDDGIERFFHKSMLVNCRYDELQEHDRVSFEHTDAIKGPRAGDIEVIRRATE